jgi:hypothetical protein
MAAHPRQLTVLSEHGAGRRGDGQLKDADRQWKRSARRSSRWERSYPLVHLVEVEPDRQRSLDLGAVPDVGRRKTKVDFPSAAFNTWQSMNALSVGYAGCLGVGLRQPSGYGPAMVEIELRPLSPSQLPRTNEDKRSQLQRKRRDRAARSSRRSHEATPQLSPDQ